MKRDPRLKTQRRWRRVGRKAVVAAALALGAAALRAAWHARQADRKYPPTGQFLDIDGVRLHYIERGKGLPVVLLHGNGAMIQDFEISGIPDRLAQRFRVIMIDRPGFGLTNRPRSRVWTAGAQAELVHKALVRLGVEQAIVVGHSWGTLVALALALDHPEDVQSLVLLAGYYFPTLRADVLAFSIPAAPVIGDLLDWTVMPVIGTAVRDWVYRRLFAPAAVAPRFAAEFPVELALRPSQIKAGAADTELMTLSAAALEHRYEELDLPVIILSGKDDKIVDFSGQSERLNQVLHNARLLSFDGVGHMIHHTIPERVVEAVNLAAHSQARPERSQSIPTAKLRTAIPRDREPAMSGLD